MDAPKKSRNTLRLNHQIRKNNSQTRVFVEK